jgi:hypothetical protein
MTITTYDLDTSARYSAPGFRGVALYIAGLPRVWEPVGAWWEDEDGVEHFEPDTGEGEWVDDTTSGRVVVVMVKHLPALDDVRRAGVLLVVVASSR